MRIYPEQSVPRRAAAGRDGEAIGAAGRRLRRWDPGRQRDVSGRWTVELLQLAQVDAFDVAANAALGKGQRHPGLVLLDDSGCNRGMRRQEIVQAVGPGLHECLEPRRTAAIALPQSTRI